MFWHFSVKKAYIWLQSITLTITDLLSFGDLVQGLLVTFLTRSHSRQQTDYEGKWRVCLAGPVMRWLSASWSQNHFSPIWSTQHGVNVHAHTHTHNASLVLVQVSLNTQGYCPLHQQLWRLFSIVWMDRQGWDSAISTWT